MEDRIQHDVPERILLRFHERHHAKEQDIINRWFNDYLPSFQDYCSHLLPPQPYSSKMYILLDLHPNICIATADLKRTKHRVFKVRFAEEDTCEGIQFQDLGQGAAMQAQRFSHICNWGFHPRRAPSSDDAEGVRPAQ